MKKHISDTQPHILIIRQWDGKRESLASHTGTQALIEVMGFAIEDFMELLTKEFPSDFSLHEEFDDQGAKTEDVMKEELTVNGRLLDRLLVTGYPPFAKPFSENMTQFLVGGEAIYIQDGVAELTYVENIEGDSVLRENLQSIRLEKSDLVISTDTPSNWSCVESDMFRFLYFVGNPNGPQRYSDVPKRSVSIR